MAARQRLASLCAALVFAALFACALGCAPGQGGASGAAVDDGPRGAVPLMPASHEGRFDDLGAPGCYGCHGSSEQANPLLATAPALPEDHYADGTSASREINPVRAQCNTCHGQG